MWSGFSSFQLADKHASVPEILLILTASHGPWCWASDTGCHTGEAAHMYRRIDNVEQYWIILGKSKLFPISDIQHITCRLYKRPTCYTHQNILLAPPIAN
ncbi:hypothetical protein LSH36_44g02012 [Paralvinella palmiformis]|uniref:Uncharacterized protein n=1 Tax=Paralvinella palmiformis TaxID=53620 RepID=A0AAD9K746_9ANNE|nr:hypothetical protein LSH36_44g02012 [Paralvinella palmiformis]